jgi:hypothetical protein
MPESTATTAAGASRARTPLHHPDHGTTTETADASARAASLNEAPRTEAWVRVVFAAMIPAIAGLYVPKGFQLVLFAITGAMFLAGVAMLVRQERGRTAPHRD